jgi:hypothetical protein
MGIYGSPKQEGMYPFYAADETRQQWNFASRCTQQLARGQLPRVNAFWSQCKCELPQGLLVAAPINCCLITLPMVHQLQRDAVEGLAPSLQCRYPADHHASLDRLAEARREALTSTAMTH